MTRNVARPAASTVEWCDNPDAPTQVIICEKEPKTGGVFSQLPFALTPGRR